MAILKEVYWRKQLYAEKRMEENAQVETLTPEQHEALATICKIRHQIHSMNRENLYSVEAVDFDMWRYIDTANYDNGITELIEEVSLPEWDWQFNCIDAPDSEDYSEENYEEQINLIYDIVDEWNSSIERYLFDIDKTHGTTYCPTGVARLHYVKCR